VLGDNQLGFTTSHLIGSEDRANKNLLGGSEQILAGATWSG
jgi:hypothetical protein